MVDTDEEKRQALRLLAKKYSPGFEESAEKNIDNAIDRTTVVAIEIESMQGKQNPPKGGAARRSF